MKRTIFAIVCALIAVTAFAFPSRTEIALRGDSSPRVVVDSDYISCDTVSLIDSVDVVEVAFPEDYEPIKSRDIVKIVAIVLGLGVPFVSAVIALFLLLTYLKKISADRNRVVELAIKEGRNLPPEFFNSFMRSTPERRFKAGLLWIAWGVGLMLVSLVVEASPLVALMTIPVLIGVAKIVTYWVFDRKK